MEQLLDYAPCASNRVGTYYGDVGKKKTVLIGRSHGLLYDTEEPSPPHSYYFKLRAINIYGSASAYSTSPVAKIKKTTTVDIENLSADVITAGSIDAEDVTITNLNATNITAGKLTLSGSTADAIRLGKGTFEDGSVNGFFLGFTDPPTGTAEEAFSIGTTANGLTYTPTAGLSIKGAIDAETGEIGGVKITASTISVPVAPNTTGVYNNANTAFFIGADGKFSLKDKLSWDGTTLTIVGAVNGGSIAIGSGDSIFKANATDGIFLGNASVGSAPFKVSLSGALIATSATITGAITVTSGAIGGINVASDKIYIGTGTFNNANTAFYVDDAGQLSLKNKLSWNGTTLAINGAITATTLNITNATVTGTLNANNIQIDGVTLDVNGSGQLLIHDLGVSTSQLNLGSVSASKIIAHATSLINPVSASGNVYRYGGRNDVGAVVTTIPSGIALTYNTADKALSIVADNNVAVTSESFSVDHNSIYKISLQIKKTATGGLWYVGATQFTSPNAGFSTDGGNGQTQINFGVYNTSRAAGTATTNAYFASKTVSSTTFDNLVVYLIGSEVDIDEVPNHFLPTGASGTPYLRLDSSATEAGIRILNWGNGATSRDLRVKNITLAEMTANTIVAQNISTTNLASINSDLGSITAGSLNINNVFTVSSAGTMVATSATIIGDITANSGEIGGFDIAGTYLKDAANTMGLSSVASSEDDVRFWAGNTFANRATAPFFVTKGGALKATKITVSGTAPSISIGNSTSDTITLSAASNHRMWVGGLTPEIAKFSVHKDGTLTAKGMLLQDGDANTYFSADGFTNLAYSQIASSLQTRLTTFESNGSYNLTGTGLVALKVTLVQSSSLTISVKASNLFSGFSGGSVTGGSAASVADAIADIPDNFTIALSKSTTSGTSGFTTLVEQTFTKVITGSTSSTTYRVNSVAYVPSGTTAFATPAEVNITNHASISNLNADGERVLEDTATYSTGDVYFRILLSTTDTSYDTNLNNVFSNWPRTLSVKDNGGTGFTVIDNDPNNQEITQAFSSGDITSVTAGVNLYGGGTSGAVTINLNSTIAGNHTFSNNLVIGGDLTVQGTTTTVDTDDLNVKDKNITLNYSTGDSSGNANGAGITIQDAVNSTTNATILWDSTSNDFDFSHAITAPSFSGASFGAASGAPDSTIWAISRDSYPTYGIFYDEGNPDKILYKWNGATKFNINMETGALDTPSTITATGGNSNEWNTGYDYSQIGHLPLSGGTLSGGLSGTTASFSSTLSSGATTISGVGTSSSAYALRVYNGAGTPEDLLSIRDDGAIIMGGSNQVLITKGLGLQVDYNLGVSGLIYKTGGADVEVSGSLRINSGGLKIGTTPVIDANRDATFNSVTISTGNLNIRTQNEENPTDVIYLGVNNGNGAGTSNDIGTGLVFAPQYTGYTKRSAGIMQIGEGNYFRSGLAFYTNNTANQTTDWSERMRLTMDGDLNIVSGSLTIGGNIVINASRNVSANTSVVSGNSSTAGILRSHYSDGSYMTLEGYGLVMNRGASYIRPSTDGDKALYIGGVDASLDWVGIYFRSTNGLYLAGSQFIDGSRNLLNIGTIDSGAIVSTGKVEGSYLQIAGSAQVSRNPSSTNGSLWLAAISSGNGGANTVSISGGASSYAVFNSDGIDIRQGGLDVGGTPVIDASRKFYFDTELHGSSKKIFSTGDSYLRMNQASEFSAGIWLGSSNLLTAGDYIAAGSNGGTTSSRVYIKSGSYNGTNVISIDGTDGKIIAASVGVTNIVYQ